jgi:hypothetical protein
MGIGYTRGVRSRRSTLNAAILVLAGCGGGSDLQAEGATATTTATTTFGTSDTGDSGDTSGDGDGTGGGDGTTPARVCAVECATAEDCDLGAGAAFDEDNYACRMGGCTYTGCTSDSECEMQSPGTICHGDPGPTCVTACTSADDCASVGPAEGPDNYACESGACVYTGCNADAECSDVVPGQICRDFGDGVPICTSSCNSAAGCPLPAQFECNDGACQFVGCASDDECTTGFVCL